MLKHSVTGDLESLASLSRRLRAVTEKPALACKLFLTPLSHDERLTYVEYFEANGGGLFIDPIELNPTVRPLIMQLRAEADVLRGQGKFGRGMGSGGRLLGWIKDQLFQRHGIVWRTNREMNPECAFD
ncbi:MAG: hypothetical protein V4495_18575 [Pseudomonadota bacterium]